MPERALSFLIWVIIAIVLIAVLFAVLDRVA